MQAPVLLVCLVGLFIVFHFWRKAPSASLWAAGGLALTIFISALNTFAWQTESIASTLVAVPVLRAVTYVLLLIAVYAARTSPTLPHAGPPGSLWQQVLAPIRAHPGLLKVFLMVFVNVFLVGFLVSIIWATLQPDSYRSTARVKVDLDAATVEKPTGSLDAPGIYGGDFLLTEFQIIQSQKVLDRVIQGLDLNRAWGRQYGVEGPLKTDETRVLLRRMIDFKIITNTSLIEIRAYSTDSGGAAQIANSIAQAYRDYCNTPKSGGEVSNGVFAEIVDDAVPALIPVLPDRPCEIILGSLTAFYFALAAGAGASWLAGSSGKRQHAKTAPATSVENGRRADAPTIAVKW